jgi:glycosyltransferase involved in cell wall biosynthesis
MTKQAVYVTNIPAPYREKIHQHVSERLNGEYHVVYAHTSEPDRLWNVQPGAYTRSFLKKFFLTFRGRFIHINFDVWSELNRLNPNIVITTGFNPTYLIAFLWCRKKRRKHIPFGDGWLKSEENLTFIHYLVRRYVYKRSSAFLGASRHTLDLYRHYHCPEAALFQSHLCADNDAFKPFVGAEKKYDIMFSGQIIPRKMPLFFVEVAILLKTRKPDLKVLIIGDGPDREAMLYTLTKAGVDFHYPGFVSQKDLPKQYSSAKVFLFPSLQDPWGVVANEACAVGVPVVTCANPGAANDLVIHDHNGFILDLHAEIWCDHVFRLLNDKTLWTTFSQNALEKVQEYNYSAAGEGILSAIRYVS